MHASPLLLRRLRLALLALACLLAAHDAVFVVQYGIGARLASAMSAGGHDGYWLPFSVAGLGAGTALLGGAMVTLHRLGRAAAGAELEAARDIRGWAGELSAVWPRLLLIVAAGFVVQENVEHLASEGALPGLGVLGGSEHPLGLLVIALVTLVAAAVGALVRWRIAVLRSLIVSTERAGRRAIRSSVASAAWTVVAARAAHARLVTRRDAGRAPPRPSVA